MKPAPRNPAAHSQAGIALIEVLVSILLFSLGILGLIGLQARAINFSVDAEDRNRAALLADELASTMWLNKTVDLPSAEKEKWEDKVESALPGASATVTPNGGTATISISWRAPSRAASAADSRLTTQVVLP
ncbi:type IV pilus modification protein PilV [Variovorax sp. MHTC-1]|uniref:type IV pilus modification protein PilV n=1 Tax=Variovorax sp. MHTC-1 TaxID=2495593 RepID=UPI000F8695E6|nr:type IV pilus modification protein PilV [Variovorax sp. MHTC-1]RST56094.1 type IV pilus modification protein PilV [Variovorax sp. MHTC-1]